MSGTIHNPIRGPYTKQAFGKFLHKGEDAWLQQPKLLWKSKSDSKGVSIGYDVFGVFDGHGGKQAANFAAKHVLPTLQEELADVTLTSEKAVPEELEAYSQLSAEDKLAWHTQDALVQQLPAALVNTFRKVQEQFHENTQVSGATATVAVIVGWDLVVASVGDSTAYLDTGAEVVQVSDMHRLDNKAERKRCEAAGSEVCKSTVDGKPVGPDRVWPGGLAMSRTIGDYMAGDVVLPEPEVRRVALPSKGARLIIASDGLWDAVNPKTAAHHVRGMQAGKAAGELVQAALKSKGLRDDITVLVIDAMPDDSFRLPPFLAKQNNGCAVTLEDVGPVDWHKPLDEAAAADACASNTWQRRTAAVQAQFKLTSAADSDHSSDTNVADLQSACSASAADSAFETPYNMSPDPLFEEDSSEWETVPVKPKREAPTTASASMPDGWAEEESSQGEAGQWEIPHKQTKLSHPPESSPETATAIKAMRDGDAASGSGSAAPDSRQKRPNRGRGRGRGQNRGRDRGRNDGNSNNGRRRYDHSQQGQSDDRQDTEAYSASQQQHSLEGDVASSWGAETVFPLAQSPLTPSPLDSSSTNSVPKVLTVPRQPHTRSMSNASSSKQQQHQQHGRGNRRDTNSQGNSRNDRGRQNRPEQYVQPGLMYHKPEQPASQNFSFGSFGADDFGSTFDASKPIPATASAISDGNSSAQVYQNGSDKVLKQHSQRGGFHGRGRGRDRSQGRGRSGNFGKTRHDGHSDTRAPAPVA